MGLPARKYEANIREGMTVLDCDGEKLGKVVELRADDIIVEKGLFFPKDRSIGYAEIAEIRGDEIYLACARDMLAEDARYGDLGTELSGEREREVERIPLAEEELLATKRMTKAGEVHVTKGVETENREIDVPVVHEVVSVDRVPASGAANEADLFEERDIDIPVREEQVDIEKRPVVREELRVRKDAVVENQTSTETVRRETADVETKGHVRRIDENASPQGTKKKASGTRR